MARKKRQEKQRQNNSQVEFQAVLRLRPLLKKERDEHVILEPTNATTVVLHPLHSKELLSPSSALVLQNNVRTQHDLEFSFDTVFPQVLQKDITKSTMCESFSFKFGYFI